jgi:DNA-binding transcriptional MerR regulator
MRAGLSIGDFSQLTHLSVKMLRRYHEAGLLQPADVDPSSGYRYYSAAQIPTAQVIRRFRELGMPVREVGEVLGAADPRVRAALIASHLDRLEAQLDHTRAAVAALRRLLRPGQAPIEVEHRSAPVMRAVAISATVALGDVLDWYSGAMDELDRFLDAAGGFPAGPPGGLYDNELFTQEHGDVTVYIPVDLPDHAAGTARVRVTEIAAAELAMTVHCGSHDDIDVTYGELGRYVAQHELVVAGAVREIYLVGPRDTDDPEQWRTEIGWPVFRTAAL